MAGRASLPTAPLALACYKSQLAVRLSDMLKNYEQIGVRPVCYTAPLIVQHLLGLPFPGFERRHAIYNKI